MGNRGRYQLTKRQVPEPTDAELESYGPAGIDLLESGIGDKERARRYASARLRVAQPVRLVEVPHRLRHWDQLAAIDPELIDPAQRVLGLKRIAARLYNFHRKPASKPARMPQTIWDDIPHCSLGINAHHVRKLWRTDKNVRAVIRKSGRYYLATVEGIGAMNRYLWLSVHAPEVVAARKRAPRLKQRRRAVPAAAPAGGACLPTRRRAHPG